MIATQMSIDEVETFLPPDSDVGKVSQEQMKILLQDPVPVQRNYNRVPRPLN